jgi:hypothetical protein
VGPGTPSPYPGPPPQRGTNGLAVASLVLGIIGGVVVGAILGIVALAQIRRTGQQGRGLAISGIVLSGAWTLLLAAGVVAAILGSAHRDGSGTVTAGGTASVGSVSVGDCLNDLPDGRSVRTLSVAPCDQPHTGEVFAEYDGAPGAYPGATPLQDEANRRCPDLIDGYAPGAGEGFDLFTLVPTDGSWRAGDRSTQCVAATDTPRSGSIRTR